MANKYRVDRNDQPVTPCGMNSILYIGDSRVEANRVYDNAVAGKDAWNQPNAAYGVLLSVWNGTQYEVERFKRID